MFIRESIIPCIYICMTRRTTGAQGRKPVAHAPLPARPPPRRKTLRSAEGVAEKTGTRAQARARTSERGGAESKEAPPEPPRREAPHRAGTAPAQGMKAERPRMARRASANPAKRLAEPARTAGGEETRAPERSRVRGYAFLRQAPRWEAPKKPFAAPAPGAPRGLSGRCPPCSTYFSRICRTSAPRPRGRRGGRICCPSGWRT